MLAHAFGPAALHRVDLGVLACNTAGHRLLPRCGFVEEGRDREAALVDDAWHDFVIMSVLESEAAAVPPPLVAR